MRTLSVFSSIFLLSALGLAQAGQRAIEGYCPYGCAPYVPMITTPIVSFTNVSPNPVGATNATSGLVAGATNSTLSEISGNTNSVYSVPVWYSGGGMPLVSPATNSVVGGMRMNAMRHEYRERMEHAQQREPEAKPQSWVYFASVEQATGSLEAASAAKGAHPAKRSYTNDDVQRQNDQNGVAKWDGKTEKIQ
jgi:hypothetical protein